MKTLSYKTLFGEKTDITLTVTLFDLLPPTCILEIILVDRTHVLYPVGLKNANVIKRPPSQSLSDTCQKEFGVAPTNRRSLESLDNAELIRNLITKAFASVHNKNLDVESTYILTF